MSLIRSVLRFAVRAALYNKTWAGDRILDSINTPLTDMLTADAAPYISIYTDEDTIPEVSDGKEVYLSPHNLSLTLEIGCAKSQEIEGTSPAEQKAIIPETDEGLEFIIDVVQHQAFYALFSDYTNPWSSLINDILFRIHRIPSARGGAAQVGTRYAARQIVIVCDTVADIPYGVTDENHVIRDFIELAKATPGMTTAGHMLELLVNQTAAPDWRQIQSWMTLSRAGIEAIGLAPVISDETAAQFDLLNLNELVPSAPTLSMTSPVSNPPVFVVTLYLADDERSAKVGDVVQVNVTEAETIESSALTAQDLANGYVSITGLILPDGSHTAMARMRRKPIVNLIVPSFSAWSTACEFIIG